MNLTLAMAGSTMSQASSGTYRHVINTVTKSVCIPTDLYSQFQITTMTRTTITCFPIAPLLLPAPLTYLQPYTFPVLEL
jgi:hypothetical protein